MPNIVLLDSGPLGMVAHPKAEVENRKAGAWLKSLLAAGTTVVIPEIADYEVRRELIRAGMRKSVNRLDQLKQTLNYLPLTTIAMLKAAEFWATARGQGQPSAKDEALDARLLRKRLAASLRHEGQREQP